MALRIGPLHQGAIIAACEKRLIVTRHIFAQETGFR